MLYLRHNRGAPWPPRHIWLPPEGQTHTRATPNVWSTPAYDEALGLICAPTGSQQPDFWGAGRSPATEDFASSVLARMWGAAFFDQLACRIAFRELRYEGEFSAPTARQSILFPGYYGGMNWAACR